MTKSITVVYKWLTGPYGNCMYSRLHWQNLITVSYSRNAITTNHTTDRTGKN